MENPGGRLESILSGYLETLFVVFNVLCSSDRDKLCSLKFLFEFFTISGFFYAAKLLRPRAIGHPFPFTESFPPYHRA